MKNTIKTIAISGTNNWKDKVLTKHFIQFIDDTNGTLTTGFDDTPAPVVGDELEYDIQGNGYGTEIKLPRKSGSGGGFGGAKKWTSEQIAQQDAIKLTCAYIESGADLKFYKAFFTEAKQFMVASIDSKEVHPTQPLSLIHI